MNRIAVAMAIAICSSACVAAGSEPEAALPVDVTTQQLSAAPSPAPLLKPGEPTRSSPAEIAKIDEEIRQQRVKLAERAARTDFDALLRQIESASDPNRKAELIHGYLVAASNAEPHRAEAAQNELEAVLGGTP